LRFTSHKHKQSDENGHRECRRKMKVPSQVDARYFQIKKNWVRFHHMNYSFASIRESPLTEAAVQYPTESEANRLDLDRLRRSPVGKERRRNRRRAMRITHVLYAWHANTYCANGTFSTAINAILGARFSTFRSLAGCREPLHALHL